VILSRRKFLLTATGAFAASRTNASCIPLNYSREANPALINLIGDSGRTSIIDRRALVDRGTMQRTLKKVINDWQGDKTWGWDYPLTAMTAARLGETEIAIDALLMDTQKNRYLPNGHNWQRSNLRRYLPGNGGLLNTVAMMAGGWRGAAAKSAPGFPDDGSWNVRAENQVGCLLT
jgi:hypothetical protein